MNEIHYPLHGRNGEYLRPIGQSELRDMINSGKCWIEKSRRSRKVYLSDGPVMLRFPAAQGSRTSFREHIAQKYYVWSHGRTALAWNAT